MNNEAFGEYRCASKFVTQLICSQLVSSHMSLMFVLSFLNASHNDLQISGEVMFLSGFAFVVHALFLNTVPKQCMGVEIICQLANTLQVEALLK